MKFILSLDKNYKNGKNEEIDLYWCKFCDDIYPLHGIWLKKKAEYRGFFCEGCGRYFKTKKNYLGKRQGILSNHIFVVKVIISGKEKYYGKWY